MILAANSGKTLIINFSKYHFVRIKQITAKEILQYQIEIQSYMPAKYEKDSFILIINETSQSYGYEEEP